MACVHAGLNRTTATQCRAAPPFALVKNIVALHDGSVTVRSDGTGKGSQFALDLPRIAV